MDEKQKILKVLEDARALIAPPFAWTRGDYKKTERRAPKGVAYCAMGAIDEAAGRFPLYVAQAAGAELANCVPKLPGIVVNQMPGRVVTRFNDHQAKDKAQVLKAFDCAISNVRSQGEQVRARAE